MESHKQTVNVNIFNQSYSIRANDGNVEKTQRLAELVDQRMREIAAGALTADSLKVAVLAAIHIADELDKANSKFEELSKMLSERSSEFSEILDNLLKDNKP